MPTRTVLHRAVAVAVAAALFAACGGGGGGGDGDGKAGAKADKAKSAKKDGDSGKVAKGGKVVAQSDFVLEANGLPFENYGNEPGVTNLTAEDMRAVYGDVVCASTADGACTLSPPGQLEMEFWNEAMAGGHCFGFSVASLLFSKAQLAPDVFGAPKVGDLVFDGNAALQRRLAQGFMAQGFVPVREQAMTGPPSAVLGFLIDHFNDKTDAETYTLGFFKPDGTGGHAVTPYAVVERGKGKYGLRIYDNNIPGEPREMTFDTTKNTWSYYAAPIPDFPEATYSGDATLDTLELYPTSPGTGTQPCWFCSDPAVPEADDPFLGRGKVGKLFVTGSPTDQPKVLLTDAEGRKTGYVDGELRTDIPGVKVEHYYFVNAGEAEAQPVFRIPLDESVTVTLTGSGEKDPEEAKVGFAGPGFAVAVGNLQVDPGQTDQLTLPSGGQNFAYEAGGTESPTLEVGVDFKGVDYALEVSAERMRKGSSIELDLGRDSLQIDTAGKLGDLDVQIDKVDGSGRETFDADGLTVAPDATGTLEYREFDESGDKVTFETEKDGKVETEQVADEDESEAEDAAEAKAEAEAKAKAEAEKAEKEGKGTEKEVDSTTTSTSDGSDGASTTTTGGTPGTRKPASTDDDSEPTTTTTAGDEDGAPPARPSTTTTAEPEPAKPDPEGEQPPGKEPPEAATTTTTGDAPG